MHPQSDFDSNLQRLREMERPDHANQLVNSLNTTDEYDNVVLPGYGARRHDLRETVGRGYGESIKALIVLTLGAAVMMSTLHGAAPVDPDAAIQVTSEREGLR